MKRIKELFQHYKLSPISKGFIVFSFFLFIISGILVIPRLFLKNIENVEFDSLEYNNLVIQYIWKWIGLVLLGCGIFIVLGVFFIESFRRNHTN